MEGLDQPVRWLANWGTSDIWLRTTFRLAAIPETLR